MTYFDLEIGPKYDPMGRLEEVWAIKQIGPIILDKEDSTVKLNGPIVLIEEVNRVKF